MTDGMLLVTWRHVLHLEAVRDACPVFGLGCLLCCLCWVSPSTRRPLLDAGWGVSAKVASELGVLPTPGGFGLQASVGVWIGHLYCTTDGDCQAEYVTE